MNSWEKFENESTEFLTKHFGKYATFIHEGKSDSTVPDIKVITKKNKQFYIEVKHSPAQCGQFVLLPDINSKKFEYSALNATELNKFSESIINYMNNNFDRFKEAGTKGANIEFSNCQTIFGEWIIKTYRDKGVKFFLTNDNTILPIESFSKYFEISAKYRVKRSGSSSAGIRNIEKLKEHLNSMIPGAETITENNKVFIMTSKNLKDKRFIIENNEYMFSKHEQNYEIRKLSNTFNANVIFSIKLKPNISGIMIPDFINFLIN